MQKIYDTDLPVEVAKKIWESFEPGDFCAIRGFILDAGVISSRGDLVLKELERLDLEENHYTSSGKKNRKLKYKKNSVGGPIAQKIFTFDKKIVESEPRVTIWRFQ